MAHSSASRKGLTSHKTWKETMIEQVILEVPVDEVDVYNRVGKYLRNKWPDTLKEYLKDSDKGKIPFIRLLENTRKKGTRTLRYGLFLLQEVKE